MKFIKVNLTPDSPPVYLNSDLIEHISENPDGGCTLWIGSTMYRVTQDISKIMEMISY